ncbi:MAG TPA: protocatechuate 3,4-dioxygenase subunit beta, partial [Candidatus Binatia bacterium]|nr:protocatechuate 3,4-dioxygenase subunit beta [Candidatus Binatia bacterium]
MMKIRPYRRHDPRSQPASLYEPYRSSIRRAPRQPLVLLPHTLSEITGPVYGDSDIAETDSDLTRQHAGEPQGERIIVTGRVVDDNGR